ncbi:MAG TPA: hypothetical protein VH595_01510 [Verrucomicrobiae bacterium]|jgi:hypothetical protein|nr:hypothetical protein [Verrucomicrobiae bacterium]
MSLRDAYRQKLEARLEEHKARLELLRAQAKRAAAHTKILAYEELAGADQHLGQAKAKLKILADASGGAMAEIKTGVTRALSDLKTASKRAADHLRANMNASQPRPPAARSAAKARAAARTRRPLRSTAARTGGR